MLDFPDYMPFFDEEPLPRAGAPRPGGAPAPGPQAGGSGIAARAMAARQGNQARDYLKGLNPEQRLAVDPEVHSPCEITLGHGRDDRAEVPGGAHEVAA